MRTDLEHQKLSAEMHLFNEQPVTAFHSRRIGN